MAQEGNLMNPDIWLPAVEPYFLVSAGGGQVLCSVGWGTPRRFWYAAGYVTHFGNEFGRGLSGDLDIAVHAEASYFQRMHVTITQPFTIGLASPFGKTFVEVTAIGPNETRKLDDPYGYPWFGGFTGYISQDWQTIDAGETEWVGLSLDNVWLVRHGVTLQMRQRLEDIMLR
jgi:hypothetical protein